jgi:hypothetical protein
MSAIASLFAVEREYGIEGYQNPEQAETLGRYFDSETFKKNLRQLGLDYPHWRKLNWTLTYP